MRKCYIAGKIGDLPEEVWRRNFELAKYVVDSMRMIPVSPVDLPHDHDKSWQNCMREDLTALLQCDCVYAQSNWKDSNGARIEVGLAKSLGIEVIDQSEIDRTLDGILRCLQKGDSQSPVNGESDAYTIKP